MFKLALGAGHGFNTAGKRCPKELDPKQTPEWWLNDRIADKVEALLASYDGVAVLRLDDSDDGADDVALATRVKRANQWGADFYLSIHHNAGIYGGKGGGIVAYCYPSASKASFSWRDKLYEALIAHTGLEGNRSTPKATANHYVTRYTSMPAVLLELGFMDSATDVPIILTEEYADSCAAAIVEVIVGQENLVRKQGTCTVTVRGIPSRGEADKLAAEMAQRGYTATVDGGEQEEVSYPCTVLLEGMPAILAKNIVPFNPNGPLSNWNNTISGSFSASKQPCSILVQDGWVKQRFACHYWYDRPESVLYRLTTGEVGIARVGLTDELPKGLRWAVGGLGLLDNYDPTAEGFCKLTNKEGKTENFSDVLRDTDHTVLGYKDGLFYLIYCKSMTAAQVNAFAKKLGLEMAVMLDGGHVAAINGADSFAKINLKQKQYYAIQGE
ncbi:MAG: N-acetylmuramoyl-L-alanine amidase [Oscillospiraceae bacterium]|nr:N-acetylmuramoyl-L-alanine amidase [Oscillospiraceae bacterium]